MSNVVAVIGLAAFGICGLMNEIHAALLLADDFNYPNGSLAGNPTSAPSAEQWIDSEGTQSPVQVVDGKAVLGVSDYVVTREFPAVIYENETPITLYVGMTINVASADSAGRALFSFSYRSGSSSAGGPRLLVHGSGEGYYLGLDHDTSPQWGFDILYYGSNYRIVWHLELGPGRGDDSHWLYVDPLDVIIDEASQPYLTTTAVDSALKSVSYLTLLQQPAEAYTITVDSLRLATDFTSAAVPEATSFALLVLAFIGMALCISPRGWCRADRREIESAQV